MPSGAYGTLAALERIGGGPVEKKSVIFDVIKYSNFGSPVRFQLRFNDFAEIGMEKAFIPELAGPLSIKFKAPKDDSITRADFKVRELIANAPLTAEYVELSCSRSENNGRSAELVLGKDDIAYRRNFGTLGVSDGRVAKAADTEFIIESFHLGQKGEHPEYVKRLRFSEVSRERGDLPITNLLTDTAGGSATGRTSLQAFRGPCVITLKAVNGGPEWVFQQFYVHRGSGSRFLVATGDAAPTILTQPQSVSVEAGDEVILTVTASGSPKLSYKWFFNDERIDGASGPALVIKKALNRHEGEYRVIISNSKGTVASDKAYLDIQGYSPPSSRARR